MFPGFVQPEPKSWIVWSLETHSALRAGQSPSIHKFADELMALGLSAE
jgi:hypothetical protein